MSDDIPLGQRESLWLEFKGADVLKDPEKIAREVVAMLNAEGGEVWVGLREEGGRAVAVEEIPYPEREQRRLRAYLLDVTEPPLTSGELDVHKVESGEGSILRVIVTPRMEKAPYALVSKGGRYFVTRTGGRTRPMSRAELFSQRTGSDPAASVTLKLLEERRAIQESSRGFFWLRLQPVRGLTIDFTRYQEHLTNPSLSENRRTGWNFVSADRLPIVRPDKLTTDPENHRRVEIRRDGGLLFEVPLEDLSLGRARQEREIWPLALLEFPTSAFRLAKTVYTGALESGDQVIADLAIFGARGWILRGGTPGQVVALNTPHGYDSSDDLLSEGPFGFDFSEISANPDACAYRIVRWVYDAFGFGENAIPDWFDRDSRRLVIPE